MDQQPPLHHPADVAFLPFSSTDADHDGQPAEHVMGGMASPSGGGSGYGGGIAGMDDTSPGHAEGGGGGMVEGTREETEGEVRRIVGEIGSLLQQLHAQTSTHYLLLLAPPFRPTTPFPHLLTTPSALSYWHSLRGGPQSNLAKFLALSIPTTTTKRLAIPEGERSLDVKARLNALMRRMVRDVSGKEEAEMKWTKPETLVGNYGVKVVGWPGYEGMVSSLITPSSGSPSGIGGGGSGGQLGEGETNGEPSVINAHEDPDGETTLATAQAQEGDKLAVGEAAGSGEEELIPLRNPSNNSVKQNKRLLSLVEQGRLYIAPATAEDRRLAEVAQTAGAAAAVTALGTHLGPTHSYGDGDFDIENSPLDPSIFLGNGEEDEGEYKLASASNARGRKRKSIGGNGMNRGTPNSKRPRSKPLLTMAPGGLVRPGPLEGRRKPGRPRKSGGGDGEEGDSIMEMHQHIPPSEGHDIMAGVVNQVNQQQQQLDRNGMEGLNEILMGGSEMGVGNTSNGYEYDEEAVDPARTLAAMSGILSHRQRVDGLDQGLFSTAATAGTSSSGGMEQ